MSEHEDRLLPIKVVFPSTIDYQAPAAGFGKPTFFGECSDSLRQHFDAQVAAVQSYFTQSFAKWGELPAIAKLRMKPQATAKSHRPEEIFNESTCPIVGANRLGELFVSVSSGGLQRLSKKVRESQSQVAQANLTAVDSLTPYTTHDALATTAEALAAAAESDGSPGLRYRLFRHPSEEVNANMELAMRRIASEAGVEVVDKLDYGADLRVFRVRVRGQQAVKTLASFIGTQSLSPFPGYRVVRSAARLLGDVTETHFPPPDSAVEYPVVGIIDSGTDPNNRYLQAWVAARLDIVPRTQQNNDHGSFVAAILARGRVLNHNDARFPETPCRIVDVVALDKEGRTNELDLLDAVDAALTRFADVRVWNLSLGGEDPCCDDAFSMLGSALDDRARKHQVTFVVAAGNYGGSPLRSWPADGTLGESDRICPPADSVRAITVGSRAHLETPSSYVRREDPSPFTRRGPGPAYLIKPEVSHYGGNCDATGGCVQSGIISVDGAGRLAEDIGTSFACPFVTSIAGHVEHQLRPSGSVTPSLIKALLIHSAFVSAPALRNDVMNYQGVGIPGDVAGIITCTQSAATVILQVPVMPRPEFGKRPFPMPKCLNGPRGISAEIFMTLLYDPPLDRGFGFEYCRTNVNASLGTVGVNPLTGEETYTREVFPVPKELTDGYEEDLIRHGYKWSPLKLYYRRLMRGPTDKPWRLTLEMLNRAEHTGDAPQNVTLIVTIRDPADAAPVYNELVKSMNQLNWNTQDLQVRSRARLAF